MNGDETTGVSAAKQAYVNGNITLDTLERALDDRLSGNRYTHDSRIDGHVPMDMRGDNYEPHGYGP